VKSEGGETVGVKGEGVKSEGVKSEGVKTWGRVLPLRIGDVDTLRAMWMPFILSGAVFVPGIEDGKLGEAVFLLMLLPGANERIAASGEVVWVNPPGAAMQAGIGVRLRENDRSAFAAIEDCLADSPDDSDAALFLSMAAS